MNYISYLVVLFFQWMSFCREQNRKLYLAENIRCNSWNWQKTWRACWNTILESQPENKSFDRNIILNDIPTEKTYTQFLHKLSFFYSPFKRCFYWMFFNSFRELNRLRKEINRLLSKEMSNVYLKVTIGKKWRIQNFDFLRLKSLSPGQYLTRSNSRRYHWIFKLLVAT